MIIDEIVKPREIVKANNELFRARYKIKDVVAARIFMAFASLVDEKDVKDNERFIEYKISATSVLNKIDAGGDTYRQIRDAAYSLIDQKLEKRWSKNSFKVYTLFSSVSYSNGIITGEFHKDLVPFFIGVRKFFTRISLQQYMKLPSIYSQRLFSYLKSWDDKPNIDIKLIELHEMLDTPESLRKDFFNFRKRVLEKAHKDILTYTSLKYEWEPIKQGCAVVSVRFIFSKRESLKVTKQKTDDEKKKQSERNNAIFLTVTECRKQHSNDCTGGHQKKVICDFCHNLH